MEGGGTATPSEFWEMDAQRLGKAGVEGSKAAARLPMVAGAGTVQHTGEQLQPEAAENMPKSRMELAGDVFQGPDFDFSPLGLLRSIGGPATSVAGNLANLASSMPGVRDLREKAASAVGQAGDKALQGIQDIEFLQADKNFQPGQGEGRGFVQGLLEDVLYNAPQMLSGGLATMVGGPAGGMAYMGSYITGGDYEKAIEEGKDVPGRERAYAAATTNALLQAPLEMIGLSKIFKAIPGKASLSKKLKTIAEAGLTEAVTEYLQAYPELATELWREKPDMSAYDRLVTMNNEILSAEFQKNAAYEGLVGMVSGGGLSSASVGVQSVLGKEKIEGDDSVPAETLDGVGPALGSPRQIAEGIKGAVLQDVQGGRLEDLPTNDLHALAVDIATLKDDLPDDPELAQVESYVDGAIQARQQMPEALRRTEDELATRKAAKAQSRAEQGGVDKRTEVQRLNEAIKAQVQAPEAVQGETEQTPAQNLLSPEEQEQANLLDRRISTLEQLETRNPKQEENLTRFREERSALDALAEKRAAEQVQATPETSEGEATPSGTVEGIEAEMETEAAADVMNQIVEAKAEQPAKRDRSRAKIITPDGAEPVRYEVRELRDVQPSHMSMMGFQPNPKYRGVNQRDYFSNRRERDKVLDHASRFEPAFQLSNNPTANDGPPVITKDGMVLGGNGRTMTLGMVYHRNPERAAQYRAQLEADADMFGIDPEALRGMKQPVLVRVLDRPVESDQDFHGAIDVFNRDFKGSLDRKSLGVSRGRFVSEDSLALLGEHLDDETTLRSFLDTGKARGLMDALVQDGAMDQAELNQFIRGNDELTSEGKAYVEHILRGVVMDDAKTLDRLPSSIVNTLDRVLPQTMTVRARGEGWDITPEFKEALRLYADYKKGKYDSPDIFLYQGRLGAGRDMALGNGKVRQLVRAMHDMTPTEFQKAWKKYAKASGATEKGVGALPGMEQALSADQAFAEAFGSKDIEQKGDPTVFKYFKTKPKAKTLPIEQILRREAPKEERVAHALELMGAAAEGRGEKREPIEVIKRGDGTYKVLNGNTTLEALKRLGETEVLGEIKRTLKQPNVGKGEKGLDELYAQAAETASAFKEYVESIAEEVGGSAKFRPYDEEAKTEIGLKGRDRAAAKVNADYAGDASKLKDVLGGTVVLETAEDAKRAYELLKDRDDAYSLKNRVEGTQLQNGYKDYTILVRMPNGHIAEVLVMTEPMFKAKMGLGHDLYEVQRQVEEGVKTGKIEDEAVQQLLKDLDEAQGVVYGQAWASSFPSASSAASSQASSSEILNAPLWRISAGINEVRSVISVPKSLQSLPLESKNSGTSSISQKPSSSEYGLGIEPPSVENIANDEGDVDIAGEEKPKLRQASQSAQSVLSQEAVEATLAPIRESFAEDVNLQVVQGLKDLPTDLQRVIREEGGENAPGVHWKGSSYIIADNLHSEHDVVFSAAHELLHQGRERLVEQMAAKSSDVRKAANKVENALDQVWSARQNDIRRMVGTGGQYEGMFDLSKKVDRRQAAEEWLAEHGIQDAPKWYDRYVAAIRQFFRAIGEHVGVRMEFSDAEIRALAGRMLEANRKPLPEGGAVAPILAPVPQYRMPNTEEQGEALGFLRNIQKGLRSGSLKLPEREVSPLAMQRRLREIVGRSDEFDMQQFVWSGVNDWLGEMKTPVSKQDVLRYMADQTARVQKDHILSLAFQIGRNLEDGASIGRKAMDRVIGSKVALDAFLEENVPSASSAEKARVLLKIAANETESQREKAALRAMAKLVEGETPKKHQPKPAPEKPRLADVPRDEQGNPIQRTPEELDASIESKIGAPDVPLSDRFREYYEAVRERGWDEVTQGTVDMFHALELVDKAYEEANSEEFAGLSKVEKKVGSAYINARQAQAPGDMLHAMILHGRPKWHERGGAVVETKSEGLLSIFEPISKAGGNQEVDQFLRWVVGERAAKLRGEEREALFDEEEIARMRGYKTPEVAQRWEDAHEKLDDFRQDVIKYGMDAGIISSDARELLNDQFYVPFYRVLDERKGGPRNARGLTNQKGIQRLHGSERNIIDPLESLTENFTKLIDAANKNRASRIALNKAVQLGLARPVENQIEFRTASAETFERSLRNALGESTSLLNLTQEEKANLGAIFLPKPPEGDNVVRVMWDGKPQYYEIDDPLLYRSLTSINMQKGEELLRNLSLGPLQLGKWARGSKRLLTAGVTMAPGFRIFRNPFRDTVHSVAAAPSEQGLRPFTDAFSGAKKIWTEDQMYVQALAGGGLFMGGYDVTRGSEEAAKDIRSRLKEMGIDHNTVLDTPRKLARFYEKLG